MSLDAAGIERLYRSHGHLVLRRARALLGAEADAQEVLQEIFASLLRAPEAVRSPGAATSWLYQATTHQCLNLLRNRRTSARLLVEKAPPPAPLTGPGAASALAEVRELIAAMPAEVAAAVVYHHLDGMTHAEVAELLGCSRRQVGYLLERAQLPPAQKERSA